MRLMQLGVYLLSLLRSDYSTEGLFQTLQHLVSEVGGRGKPVCLVVDGLSVLLSVGVQFRHVVRLVQMCTHLLTSTTGPCQGEGYVVAMVHCEGGGVEEPEQLLRTHLLHLCHLHLQARGLTTGHSKDIHGEVSVSWRDPACSGRQLPPQQIAHYKVNDKSVQIFAKGTSPTII